MDEHRVTPDDLRCMHRWGGIMWVNPAVAEATFDRDVRYHARLHLEAVERLARTRAQHLPDPPVP